MLTHLSTALYCHSCRHMDLGTYTVSFTYLHSNRAAARGMVLWSHALTLEAYTI